MAKRKISIEDRRRRDFVRHWKGDAIEAARAAGFRDPKLAAFMLMQDASIYAQLRKRQAHLAEAG